MPLASTREMEAGVIVAGFNASLKVIIMTLSRPTLVAPLAGLVDTTSGHFPTTPTSSSLQPPVKAAINKAANAVISFPILVIVGILLFRLGQLLLLHVANDDVPGEATNYRNRLIGLIGRAATLIGAGGPVVAAMGYGYIQSQLT